MRRVVVTGLGVVSPVGCGKDVFWRALREGRSGVGPISLFDTEGYSVTIAAEVRDFNPEDWMDKKEARRCDRVIRFAAAAADMALADSNLDLDSVDKERFGVYVGSGEGGITTTHENYAILRDKGPSRVSPFFIPMMLSNMPAAYIGIRTGAKGPNMAVVTACASATNSLGEAYNAIIRDDADLALAGGAEAAITPIAIAGFATLKALSTRNDDPQAASRPFDLDRDGFVMGEGAGILLLEEREYALRRGARIYAELVGYGLTCDAYHITAPAPDGDGPARAMRMAMRKAGWSPESVDLINAHGTSTPLNDKMETRAINSAFGDHARTVRVQSTKSMVGHTLGAAGAIETIAALAAVEEGMVHPTINYRTPDPECQLRISAETEEARIDRILINNFGFGGHNAVLALQRHE